MNWLGFALLLTGCISCSNGCSCFTPGPSLKDQLCSASFVIRTKVLSELRQEPNAEFDDDGWYRIRRPSPRNIIKMGSNIDPSALRRLYTPIESGMCGVYLQNGEKYIIAGSGWGSRLHVDLCSSLIVRRPGDADLRRKLWRLKRGKLNC